MPDQRFAQRDTWKRMVGITLAYAGLNFWATGVGSTSNQPLAVTCIYVSRSDEQNDIGPTSWASCFYMYICLVFKRTCRSV